MTDPGVRLAVEPKRLALLHLLRQRPRTSLELCALLRVSHTRLANVVDECERLCGVTVEVRRGRFAAYVLHETPRRCRHAGCTQVLSSGNTSGLCRRHQPQDILAALESALCQDLMVNPDQGVLEVEA